MKMSAAVLLPLLAALPLYAAETPLSARLAEVKGAVWARAAATSEWAAVRDGVMLAPGGEVRTGRDASAVLAFSDGNKVRLGPATVFGVEGATTLKTSLRLLSGRLQAWVKRVNKADFTVRHAAGVAAVRGTVFEMIGSGPDLKISLFEGALDVVDAFGRASSLSPGQNAAVSQTAGLTGIAALPADTKAPEEPKVDAPPPPPPAATAEGEKAPPPEEIAAETKEIAPASTTQEKAVETKPEETTTVSPSAPPP